MDASASVFLDGIAGHAPAASHTGHRLPRSQTRAGEPPLRVALVNNMPDSALVATERQFSRLASAAAGGRAEIRLFHIPAIPRGDEAKRVLNQHYQPVSELYRSTTDIVIVTGNEPRAARLDDEPYWPELTQLIDWTKGNTAASLWSCLAAHAAVLHLDGIERRRLPLKKSGVLACETSTQSHDLLPALSVCHSRLNEVRKDDLLDKGYAIVSEAPGAQVDIFEKTIGSRFTFLQGHPEYEPDSLMREYRRDVGRYLNGQRDSYPEIPENYFDSATTLRMENYRTLAERTRDIRLFETFPAVTLRRGLEDRLAASAASVFSNWVAGARARLATD